MNSIVFAVSLFLLLLFFSEEKNKTTKNKKIEREERELGREREQENFLPLVSSAI